MNRPFGPLRRTRLAAAAAILLGALTALPAHEAQASRYGYGHGHHGGARVSAGVRYGHGGYRRGHRAGIRHGRGHHGGHRYRPGYRAGHAFGYGLSYRSGHGHGRYGHSRGAVSIYYSAPLVAPYAGPPVVLAYAAPPATRVIASPPVVVERRVARALPSMPELEYTPLRGQDDARATLDRRECESLAWRETLPDQASGYTRTTTRTEVTHGTVRYRGDPVGPTVTGTVLGAIGGGIAGDAGAGAAIGAIAGAASWMLGGWGYDVPVQRAVDVVQREYVPPPGPDPADLREALALCMEGRGYGVR